MPIDEVGVEERARRIQSRSLKADSKLAGLKLAVSMMDLTTLEGHDTPGKLTHLCGKAVQPMDRRFDCPPVAAVCVYPNLVRAARAFVGDSGVHVASVATAFPSGQYPLDLKLEDTRRAIDEGADEIDMVIDRGGFLAGETDRVFDEIAAVREICGSRTLKVILETGELQTFENVRRASDLAMDAGADFIKTSTGKMQPAATLPVTIVMLEAIRDFHFRTGSRVGMKPAGGLRRAKEALSYLVAVKEILGDSWLSAEFFRFGASSLLTDVTLQIARMTDGRYQSEDYFALP